MELEVTESLRRQGEIDDAKNFEQVLLPLKSLLLPLSPAASTASTAPADI
jgi:hypothetical protein